VTNVRLDGMALSHSVPVGSTTNLTADLDDAFTGNSNIANASFSFEGAMGIAMNGAFDSPTEEAWYDIVTGVAPYLEGGPYAIIVYGSDILGNDNMVGASIQLTITGIDDEAPELANLAVDGQPSKSVQEGTTVVFTGDVDDAPTGASNIHNASYLIRDGSGVVTETDIMTAQNPPFDDSFMETVTADIDTTGWADDTYTLHIYACDAWAPTPNCNYTETEQATLTVEPLTDDEDPPEISSVAADVVIFQLAKRTTINLTATVTDINTAAGPPSNVGGANYTEGAINWPGAPMTAVDGAFDETSEDVTVEIDVFGWSVGTYDLYVYGIDAVGNANITSTEYVTIEVTLTGDWTPPVIGTVTIDPDSPEEGDSVEFTVTVTDDHSAADDLTVTITITGPGATPIVTDAPMTLSAGIFTYPSPDLDDTGGYSYTITA
ncbi:MAG: hypothetical protein KAW09_11960, partial [Thermoplasmata archaeon]|nr:hypothetical protein [Thermoplasmata archaeon]